MLAHHEYTCPYAHRKDVQKAVLGDVGLEAGDVCLAAAGELAI